MSRSKKEDVPRYRRHPNGYAFVYHRRLPGPSHRLYLGKYGTDDSLQRYREFIHRLKIDQAAIPAPAVGPVPKIMDLALAYDEYSRAYYRRGDELSTEYGSMKYAISFLLELDANTLAIDYGPKALKRLQRSMVQQGYARSLVNQTTSKVKRLFRWAASEEMVDPAIYHRLLCVRGLTHGELGVRESEPVRPTAYKNVLALLPYVSPAVGAMMQVQYLCGMRPAEVCLMRSCDVDCSGDIWLYRPHRHKNSRRNKELVKAIPKVAQSLIADRLKGRGEAEYLFCPQEGKQWAIEDQLANPRERKAKLRPSEKRRVEREKSRAKRRVNHRPAGEKYTTASYRRAISYGVRRAMKAGVEVERFAPNQLRHAILTFLTQSLGQEKAQRYAGHEHLSTTSIYVEKSVAELTLVARQLDDLLSAT